jgi:hypothetical protein
VTRVAEWLARYAVVSQKIGSHRTRPLAWWALTLRGKLNCGRITVEDVEEAVQRVPRIRVLASTGATNIMAARTFSMFRGES